VPAFKAKQVFSLILKIVFMKDLGVPLNRDEMKKITGGLWPCFECTSWLNPTLATFYCQTQYDCIDQTLSVCEGQVNCECHAA
jgi:hypothetical protein